MPETITETLTGRTPHQPPRPWDDATGDVGILRRWTHHLSRRMQAVLVAAVRGCDGAPKHDPSKQILWALRWDTMNPSNDHFDPTTTRSFMGYVDDLDEAADAFFSSLDQYPLHFVLHLLHAAEICGYFHPDPDRQKYWRGFYTHACVEHMHMTPESEALLVHRLRDR